MKCEGVRLDVTAVNERPSSWRVGGGSEGGGVTGRDVKVGEDGLEVIFSGVGEDSRSTRDGV